MATRFKLSANTAAAVSVTPSASWNSTAAPFAQRKMFTTNDAGDTLTTISGFTSTAGQLRAHTQYVSDPMDAGFTFDTTTTHAVQIQVLESAVNDNCQSRMGIRIVSQDGTTVRHTVLAVAEYGPAVEWNTALRNKTFANGDLGTGSYTTVSGDRLVLEYGHTDVAGSSISSSSRRGRAGSADLGVNETSTSTTERPWYETSLTLTFLVAAGPSPGLRTLSLTGAGI